MRYLQEKQHHKIIFIFLLFLLLATMLISLAFGSLGITIYQTFKIILVKIPLIKNFIGTADIKEHFYTIIFDLRMPRIVLAAFVGAGLSVVGSCFQGMFKNEMTDPYVLGVSSGAAFGATVAIVLKTFDNIVNIGFINFSAFLGAIISTYLVFKISNFRNIINNSTLLLAGISSNLLFSSLISILMFFNKNKIERIFFWGMGSFSASNWNQVIFVIPIILICISIIFMYSASLNVLSIGDESAKTLGLNVEKIKKVLLLVCSILVAVCVSSCGIIGFVGLIIPHVTRILFSYDHKILLPFSALIGGIFTIFTDTISRSILATSEIPIGTITAIIGVPYFMYILIKNKKKVV